MQKTHDILFTQYPLNTHLILKNRIIMAPMTRNMAQDDLSPTEDMAQYYARRSSAGLIITEGTIIRNDARGYSHVPGIFTETQIASWHKVTAKVHENGGAIFVQLWHVGRVSHPDFLDGNLPVAPSATEMSGQLNRARHLSFGKSRALEINEIQGLVASFAQAAKNAMQAGFNGIELHGANGYLIDQFLHYHTNQRQDLYGGSAENNARFALEVVTACGEAIGFENVAIRLSPGAYLHQIKGYPEDALTFQYLLSELSKNKIAYVHTGSFNDKELFPELQQTSMTAFLRQHFTGTVIGCGSYTFDEARVAITAGKFDLIAIGRPFLANPDLVDKVRANIPLIPYDDHMLEVLY